MCAFTIGHFNVSRDHNRCFCGQNYYADNNTVRYLNYDSLSRNLFLPVLFQDSGKEKERERKARLESRVINLTALAFATRFRGVRPDNQ